MDEIEKKRGGASWTLPSDLPVEVPETQTENPSRSKRYLEIHLRIRFAWLIGGVALALVAYPIAVIYTAISMRYFQETTGPAPAYQHQWEATGCPARIKRFADDPRFAQFAKTHRWKHLLLLDDSYLALNNQEILDDPLCLGARIAQLIHKPGPWRYDIVDTQRQSIIVTIKKGE